MSRHFVVIAPGRRVGVVASTYKDFLRKCRSILKVKKEKELTVTLVDGTEVDKEYFEVLVSNTELQVSPSEENKAPDFIHQLAGFLNACLQCQPKIHDRVFEYLQEAKSSAKAKELLELLAKVSEEVASVSSRDSDFEWFRGLNTKFKTKEAVMQNSAETRIRSYLYQTKQELLHNDPPEGSPQRQAITFFMQQLSSCRYNRKYFDRTAAPSERLCDSHGLFECEGPYDKNKCDSIHFINPYTSREARIIFSTWNLDHVVEKSRTVLPTLKSALSGPKASVVNLSYFYNLLFCHKNGIAKNSSGNLKLVHIACHVKKPHELQCEHREIYLCNKTSKFSDAVDGKQSRQCPVHSMKTRFKRKNCNLDHITKKRPRVTRRHSDLTRVK